MIKNNLISFISYLVITIISYKIYGWITYLFHYNLNHHWQWVLFSLLAIVTLFLCLISGRLLLKGTHSSLKNFFSCILITFTGLICEWDLLWTHGDNFVGLFFAYTAPIYTVIYAMGLHQIPEFSSMLSGLAFSLIPTFLMWLGLEWQEKTRN